MAEQQEEPAGPYEQHSHRPSHHEHSWWKVMCLTGVDYFSTLGYQPGIAFVAAGALSPIATAILVLLTLFGALPIYRRVAAESPHGEGSIAMLRSLLNWWQGKLFILVLLGFVATDFVITITLSAADATAHIVENPLLPHGLEAYRVPITLVLVAILGAVFLKGFGEAIGIAIVLVAVYLALNAVVVFTGLMQIVARPEVLASWQRALFAQHANPFAMIGVALLVFPKLALGLSGFETGVAVMPLVKGDKGDNPARPAVRIRNARRLLFAAAAIMSCYLIASSLITATLIPPEAFAHGGEASGRALAYLAHHYLGPVFGTAYDVSTIAILWFAGASAMAGLLNIVPRYLPRYGMAPAWTVATRPLVLVFTALAFAVTVIFHADVEAQGGAYATGVLVLMSSAAVAVTITTRRSGERRAFIAFAAITLVFLYTTVVNVIERPDGIKIASFFIGAIVVTSLVSRVLRATELRVSAVEVDRQALHVIRDASHDVVRLIANHRDSHPDLRDAAEYARKEREAREDHHIPPETELLFFEVDVVDPSEFESVLRVRASEVEGHRVLRAESTSVANATAAFLLWVRDTTGQVPHVYFSWGEANPLLLLLRFLIFGEGDIPPVTREILRQAEPDPERRPAVHVG
ncbi:MAG TPA: amino acid transporter [Chloroflexota bacterium]|nr:amino acid transporter [Chloroflexota bacterium]